MRAADLEPTENYFLFSLALKMHQTVGQMVQNMTGVEYYLWKQYFRAKARLAEQEKRNKPAPAPTGRRR